MDAIEAIKTRRSIRRFKSEQISRKDADQILDAGLFAPNAGGGQRSMIIMLRDAKLAKQVGLMNMQGFSRARLIGNHVSAEQPSVIDNPAIRNGFYDAPAVACIFCQENFAFSVADGFVIAQTMALAAHDLGISSCIVSRAEQTFRSKEGREMIDRWGVPNNYICRAFLALGYCDGAYPQAKARKAGRIAIVEEQA